MTSGETLLIAGLCMSLAWREVHAQASPTPRQTCPRQNAILTLSPDATQDDAYEVVARLVPGGFGGLTRTYFFLKEPALADTVREMARVLAPCSSELLSGVWTVIQHADVRQGQYDWIELRRWYAILLKVENAGFRSLDIDEAVNRLSYAFMTEAALESFRSRAEALGVPKAALVLKVEHPER
jgi:hypothetical protein